MQKASLATDWILAWGWGKVELLCQKRFYSVHFPHYTFYNDYNDQGHKHEGCVGLLFGVTLGTRELAHYNAIKMSATGFIHSTSFKGKGNTIYICRKTFQTMKRPENCGRWEGGGLPFCLLQLPLAEGP